MRPWWEVHPGDGPFLLLVHGFLCGAAQWTPNLDALAAVCRPVVVELYGHGRSPSPEDTGAYAPASVIDFLSGSVRTFDEEGSPRGTDMPATTVR